MNKKILKINSNGYTLIELLLVIAIISILASLVSPKFENLMKKAYQSKSKGDLASIRSMLNIYYSDNDSRWPLAGYPQGDSHYTSDGLSLTNALVPRYGSSIPTPKFFDRTAGFNGLSADFDSEAAYMMALTPPKDVYIVWGPADYTPLLDSPYAYDNKTGTIYYPNGNNDYNNNYFYTW